MPQPLNCVTKVFDADVGKLLHANLQLVSCNLLSGLNSLYYQNGTEKTVLTVRRVVAAVPLPRVKKECVSSINSSHDQLHYTGKACLSLCREKSYGDHILPKGRLHVESFHMD